MDRKRLRHVYRWSLSVAMDCASYPSIATHCGGGLRAFKFWGKATRALIVETSISSVDGGVLLREQRASDITNL